MTGRPDGLLLLAGSVTLVLAVCFKVAPVGLGIATGALWVLGLIALAAWVVICGKNHCDIVSTVAQALLAVAGVAGLLTIGAGIAKGVVPSKEAVDIIDCLLTNGAANTAVHAVATGLVHWIGQAMGCIIYKKQSGPP